MRRLSGRQLRFVLAVVGGSSLVEAARTAGYSERTADRQGHRLLKNADIRAEIAKRQGRLAKRLEISTENLVFGMARIAHVDPRRLFDHDGKLLPITELDDDTAFAIEAVEVVTNKAGETVTKVKFSNRNQAQANLARALGLRGFRPGALDLPPPPDLSPVTEARTALADLLTDASPEQLQKFRETVNVLKELERHKVAQTIDGEAEEEPDDEDGGAG
jgi:phage terminase small subunit